MQSTNSQRPTAFRRDEKSVLVLALRDRASAGDCSDSEPTVRARGWTGLLEHESYARLDAVEEANELVVERRVDAAPVKRDGLR